jgi:(2Fe-2S) ferredoxin
LTYYQKHIFICTNQKAAGKKCCADAGSGAFFDYLKEQLVTHNLHGPGKIRVSKSGCLGRCSEGPCLVIYPEGIWHTFTCFADLDKILQDHKATHSQS